MRAPRLTVFVGALLCVSSAMAQGGGAEASSEAQATGPGAASDREAARAAFERGLSLVRQRRYAEAKAAFLEAYGAYPHYVVLYNVAQADAQLGDLRSAITYLERFLREGADVLSSERRQEVSAQMEELRQKLAIERNPRESETAERAVPAAEPQEVGPPAPAQQAPDIPRAPPEPPASTPAPSIASASIESGTHAPLFVAPMVAPVRPAPALETDKTWGLLLGASGIALLSVASGLYFWNDSRHDNWKQDRQALDALPEREQALAGDPEVWQRAKANNELLESIERVDVVTIVAASVGALALGAGTWELLARSAPTPAIIASGAVLNWRSSW